MKKLYLLLSTAFLCGCSGDGEKSATELWNIAFETRSIVMEIDDAPQALELLFYPSQFEEKVNFEVTPAGVLTYDGSHITPQAVGEATITAKTGSSNKIATCNVTITNSSYPVPTGKKGACFNYSRYRDWPMRLYELKPYWFYSWTTVQPQVNVPENVEWVPLFQNGGQVTSDNVDRIKTLYEAGSIKYVLGFNEPDLVDQANMSVDQAIGLWPQLESIGAPLGSPAISNGQNGAKWLDEFMADAGERNLNVDFICIHWYGAPETQNFINYVTKIYEKYRLPLWITEFGVADYTANKPEANKYSTQQVHTFLEEVLEFLDQTSWIHRYAWFTSASYEHQYVATSSLFDEDSKLTELGELYAAFDANTNVVKPDPSPDPDPTSNIVQNPGFEEGEGISPWSGYNCDKVTKPAIPYAGSYYGRIKPQAGSLYQIVDVTPGEAYDISAYVYWNTSTDVQCVAEGVQFEVRKDSNEGEAVTKIDIGTVVGQWIQIKGRVEIPLDVNKACLFFSKPGKYNDKNTPALFIDEISMTSSE